MAFVSLAAQFLPCWVSRALRAGFHCARGRIFELRTFISCRLFGGHVDRHCASCLVARALAGRDACYAKVSQTALGAYPSFVISQDWYSYAGDPALETGFLAISLPVTSATFSSDPACARRRALLVTFASCSARADQAARRCLLARLSCLDFHYETQPIPNPLSRWFHFHPPLVHILGTAWNHFIELVVPWFAFGPRRARHIAGVLLVSFQLFLILSGNLSFLNYLTIVPMLACFDDSLLGKILPKALVARAQRAAENTYPTRTQELFSLAYARFCVVSSRRLQSRFRGQS